MRYAKNSLVVSPERDVPLLRQVRNSKFVTHQQLFEFMKLCGCDHNRDAFNWRVRRLKTFGHITDCPAIHGLGSAVYQITKAGLCLLEHCGHSSVVLNSNTAHLSHLSNVYHALGMNAVQLALTRVNLLASWQSEIEIASFNTISTSPLQKDYDAIVEVWVGEKTQRFALEYERTLKSAKRYEQIRAALESEREIKCILYLTSGLELISPLVRELGYIKKRVAFATLRDFENNLLDTHMFTSRSTMLKFGDFLKGQ
jgi:hypothetical protein